MDYIIRRMQRKEIEIVAGWYTPEKMKSELKFSKQLAGTSGSTIGYMTSCSQ